MSFIALQELKHKQNYYEYKEKMIINWIHTLILTHISDVEAATVRPMVRGPAQQQLVACRGQTEWRFYVTTERGKALTVDVGA